MAAELLLAIGSDLPVRALAVVGAFALGGFGLGWLVRLGAGLFRQKLPGAVQWALRALGGIAMAWITALWLFGGGGGGVGGSGGLGLGSGTGSGPDKDSGQAVKADEKNPEKKVRPDPPPADEKTSLAVEILGDAPLARRAGATTFDSARRYRIVGEMPLRTLEDIKDVVRQRREGQPRLRRLTVVLYLDSPERQRPQVSALVDWVNDLEARPHRIEVDFVEKDRHAPID
ncbi:MAG: hypothetical protein U0840_09125 [Gemmataceae bacterium]